MKISRNELKRELLFLCEALKTIQREGIHITKSNLNKHKSKFLKEVEIEMFDRKIDNLARHLVSFKRFVEMIEDEN